MTNHRLHRVLWEKKAIHSTSQPCRQASIELIRSCTCSRASQESFPSYCLFWANFLKTRTSLVSNFQPALRLLETSFIYIKNPSIFIQLNLSRLNIWQTLDSFSSHEAASTLFVCAGNCFLDNILEWLQLFFIII